MKEVSIVFPHQLFAHAEHIIKGRDVVLVEEYLFFKHYKFHQQKILFHRASMKAYADDLVSKEHKVTYVPSLDPISDIRLLVPHLAKQGFEKIHFIDPTDGWLTKRLTAAAGTAGMALKFYDSPLFLNTPVENQDFFKPTKKKFYQTAFYKQEREKRGILLNDAGGPLGGAWSFDTDNRKKYPLNKTPPHVQFAEWTAYHAEAYAYVQEHFGDHYGNLNKTVVYPIQRDAALKWLQEFLEHRFAGFGDYEDAIVKEELVLHHSLLSPLMNVGLLSPHEVIESTLKYGAEHDIAINTLEGFTRQVIGWREFIRGVYEAVGTKERTRNFWGFDRKIPASFYDGTTGIEPIDNVIRKVLRTGYCHHIERLMVVGNFMLLCEFDPDEVYRWYMELFIDSYDWVMVTNVYGMSQFADGGMMSTKPYISSSNYLMKMSNYKKGEWQEIWDALFWRFMHVNRDFFQKNPRLGMLVRTYDKMDTQKCESMTVCADQYLWKLESGLPA